jgi:uncharacterized protein GlcG (DUF336 family)
MPDGASAFHSPQLAGFDRYTEKKEMTANQNTNAVAGSTSKAKTIVTKHSQSEGEFFGIHVSNNGKIMICAGIPLKLDGKVVEAIGVSGGSGDQDHAVAIAGAAAL